MGPQNIRYVIQGSLPVMDFKAEVYEPIWPVLKRGFGAG
jgi:hypothetical protein